MYKLSKGLVRAFKNSASIAAYGEGVGVVPTHAGHGTSLDANGTPVDPASVRLHDRAMVILAAAIHTGMTYGDALRIARKEIADKALAEKRGQNFHEGLCFDEGSRIPISQASIQMAERANAIMAENKWPNSRFGEALELARREMRKLR
jgi:hypothetical protein